MVATQVGLLTLSVVILPKSVYYSHEHATAMIMQKLLLTLRATRLPKKMSCSEMGNTRGPRVVMLAFRA